MMTKKSSSVRKKMLVFSILPIAILLLVGLGNPVISQSQQIQKDNAIVEYTDSFKDRYFEHAIVHYETKGGKTKMISYKSLNDDIKAKITPPPPFPPGSSGTSQKNKVPAPLPKGTVVYLSKNGSIFIGDKKNGGMKVPPPPPPAPKGSKSTGLVIPPPPPPRPVAPMKPVAGQPIPPIAVPAPPAPPTLIEFVKDGARVYINGKKATEKEIQGLNKMNADDIERIDIKKEKDGNKSVYIILK